MNTKCLSETDILLDTPKVVKILLPHGVFLVHMLSENDAAEALTELRQHLSSNPLTVNSGNGEIDEQTETALHSVMANLRFSSKVAGFSMRDTAYPPGTAHEHKLDHLEDVKYINELLDRSRDTKCFIDGATARGFEVFNLTPAGLIMMKPSGAALLIAVRERFHPTNLFNVIYGNESKQIVNLIWEGERT